MTYVEQSPAPNPVINVYERGSQAILIAGATGTVTQVNTAFPVGANVWGVQAGLSRGMQPPNAMVQVDVNAAGGTGAFSAWTVNLLGSLDGIKFYVLASFASTGAGGIYPVAGAAQARYLSASITTATVGSGAPDLTVTMAL